MTNRNVSIRHEKRAQLFSHLRLEHPNARFMNQSQFNKKDLNIDTKKSALGTSNKNRNFDSLYMLRFIVLSAVNKITNILK